MLDPEDQRELMHERAVERAYANTGFHRIDVDINSLSDFADALKRELTENLYPAWQKINNTLIDDGPQFGNTPALDLGDKRTMYNLYLQETKDFLRNVINGVAQFAQSADEIGRRYQRSDQFAEITVTDVTSVLPDVRSAANPTPSNVE
jgi:hypothetical protein